MRPQDFYTVPKSEGGVRVPLLKPDGSDSGEWLQVIGPDSVAYARASTELRRRGAEVREAPEAERDKLSEATFVQYAMALIIGWSFEDEMTPEALREFLYNAPRIAQQVANTSTDVSRFFGPASANSTSGPSASDSSPEATENSQKAA